MLGKASRVVVEVDVKEEECCWESVDGMHGEETRDELGLVGDMAHDACTPTPSVDAGTLSIRVSGQGGGGRRKSRQGLMFGRRGIFGGLEEQCTVARLSDEYDPRGGLVSPVPKNAWQHIEGGVSGSCESEVLKAWVNAVLCPWDGGLNGSRRASIESSVEIYSHKDVLKARMMSQLGQEKEGLFGSVDRVCKSLERDVIRLAMDVEDVMCTAVLKAKVQKGFASYSKVWLDIAHSMVKEMYSGLSEREERYARVVMQLSRKNMDGKIPPAGYLRVVRHLLAVVLLLDDIYSSTRDESDKDVALRWKVPIWAPLLFSYGRGNLGIHASHHVLQSSMGTLLKQVDVERYLRRFGYCVSYVQSPRLCVHLGVENLSVDLRDGVRLCRLADVLCAEHEHALKPRYPASKRSDRINNICIAMKRMGFDASVAPHVADGDYSATTSLLWDCIITYEIPRSLNTRSIQVECDIVLRESACPMSQVDTVVDSMQRLLQHESMKSSTSVAVLLKWLCCICASEKNVMLEGDVLSKSTDRKNILESILSYYGRMLRSPGVARKAVYDAVQAPFDALDRILKAAGGVPLVVTEQEYFDSDLDHRRLVVFYAVLCKRVMSMQYEQRAATVIQRFWRRVRHRKPGYSRDHLQKWIHAAVVIQRNVRPYLFRRRVDLSAPVRQALAESIAHMQALWRGRMQRATFLKLRESTVIIQSAWRGFSDRRIYQAVKDRLDLEAWAAVKIQSHWRGHVCCAHYASLQRSCISIQRYWRMAKLRECFISMKESACVIQVHVRRRLAEQTASHRLAAVVHIQAVWRRHVARKHFQAICHSSVVIQNHFRRQQAKKVSEERLNAVLTIQRIVRARRHEQIEAMSQTLQDKMNRLYDTMYGYSRQISAAMKIQQSWRAFATAREHARRAKMQREQLEWAAVVIQSAIRAHLARTRFITCRMRCVQIQRSWRNHKRYEDMKTSIQSLYMDAKARVALKLEYEQATVVIQTHFRGYQVRSYHPHCDMISGIRERLHEANVRAKALEDEGVEDPTSLRYLTESALRKMRGGSVLPELEALEYLSRSLGSSCACCESFIGKQGVAMLIQAIASTSRDQSRRDSMCEGFKCLTTLCACGRFVDRVGNILIQNGLVETLLSLLFQIREQQACFHSLVEMLRILTSSENFCSYVGSTAVIVEKLQGVHRAISMKHSQVSAYLTRLEGQKGSDVSAANATKTLFKLKRQITVLDELLEALRIQKVQATNPSVGQHTVQGKNTIVRQALAEIKNTTRI